MDEHQPQVPVPAAAFISYTEAVSMHPTSDPAIGHKSTDLPIPDAAKVLFVDELLEAGPTGVDESESFASVLARRRSIREYEPLSAKGLVRVLDQVFKLQGFAHADDGAIRRFRPIPSAGARHPVVPLILIGDVAGLESGLWRLDTDGRRLLLVETDPTALNAAWTKVLDAGQFGERPLRWSSSVRGSTRPWRAIRAVLPWSGGTVASRSARCT